MTPPDSITITTTPAAPTLFGPAPRFEWAVRLGGREVARGTATTGREALTAARIAAGERRCDCPTPKPQPPRGEKT